MLLLPDFYAFYGVFACPACVSSSLINSGFFLLDLLAGGSPAASNFLLLRQKKVTKEKATRLSGSLRFASGNLRCLKKTGVGANSLHCVVLKQRAALIPFLWGIAGPDRTGQSGNEIQTAEQPNSHCGQFSVLDAINSIAGCACGTSANGTFDAQAQITAFVAVPVPVPVLVPESVSVFAPASPVLAGPVMSGKSGIRAARCLSRRRVCADPRFCRSSQAARSVAQGPRQPGRLFFGDFLLAKQKKVTCRRATPGQQNQAKLTEATNKTKPATGTRP